MSVIKIVFGLGVAVLFLPTDREGQQKLFATAQTTVARAATFCERNPATCTRTAEYWAVFRQKAQFGGETAWAMVQEWSRSSERREDTVPTAAATLPPPKRPRPDGVHPSRGTLSARDLEPAWRAPRQGT